jgi:glycosyltransferase involved in cell wall biosynthesis
VTLVWRGPVLDRSSWAAGSRAALAGLRDAGAAPALEPLVWHPGSVVGADVYAALAAMAALPPGDGAASVQAVPARMLDPYARGRLRVARTRIAGPPAADALLRLRQMDDVWVASAAERDLLLAAGLEPGRVAVVPEPVEMPAGSPAPLPVADLHGTVVLVIADRAARSGWDLALDAWCRAFGPGDDVALLLHLSTTEGPGDDHAEAVVAAVRAAGHDPAAMPDVVLLEEAVPAADMPGLYAAAAVVCAPTRGLGRGRDLLEAMACGRPVIATPDAAGIAIPADAGWTAAADADALAAALCEAHARRDELPAMGARARAAVEPHEAGRVARAMLARLETAAPRRRARSHGDAPRVALYGAVTRSHSLALVNRSLADALVRRGEVDLSVVEVEPADPGDEGALPRGAARRAVERLFAEPPEVTVRHGYPPSFARPPHGRQVVILPWEFGPIPRDWREAIVASVDEVWVPSRHVRDGYAASGLDPGRVHVVPNGIDPARFHPALAPLDLPGLPGGYRFLFLGGLLWRKGVDLLLEAYRLAFTARDDVTLVVKDFGRAGPYRPQEAEERVRAMAADPGGPRVAFLRERLADADLPRLYASCDCLVHPYRGEGYGLTVAEAMACGRPAIVPAGGATADFCDDETAMLVPSRPLTLDRTRVGDHELTGPVSVIEVGVVDLARRMREAYEDRAGAAAVGRRAAERMRAHHTWDHAAAVAARRLRALARGEVRA